MFTSYVQTNTGAIESPIQVHQQNTQRPTRYRLVRKNIDDLQLGSDEVVIKTELNEFAQDGSSSTSHIPSNVGPPSRKRSIIVSGDSSILDGYLSEQVYLLQC